MRRLLPPFLAVLAAIVVLWRTARGKTPTYNVGRPVRTFREDGIDRALVEQEKWNYWRRGPWNAN